MKIVNKGKGPHVRELAGIDRLAADLPDHWVAFTNLELAIGRGQGREIDIIMVIEDRILVVDLKDWRGPITSEGGYWKNGAAVVRSPVEKILANRREVSIRLQPFLQDEAKRKGTNPSSADIPVVLGFVVLTSCKDRTGIAPTEQDSVYSIDPFIKMLRNKKERIEQLGGVSPAFHSPGLASDAWLPILGKFFNVKTGPFRISYRSYGSYKALSDSYCYQHPLEVFSEYDVEDPEARSTGLLRRWDFTKAEVHFQSEAGRREIAGRERTVVAWLNDRNVAFESAVFQPRDNDPELGVDYWEVFDRRRKLRRLIDDAATGFKQFTAETRTELARQILAQAKLLHDIGAAHLDIGTHSVWVELPATVRLSHLMAASFPDIPTLGERRYQFLSSVRVPEQVLGVVSAPQVRDVYQLGIVIHQLCIGCLPAGATREEPGEWSDSVDPNHAWAHLYPWFSRALDLDPSNRFRSAGEMLLEFNKACSTERSVQSVLVGLERFRTLSSQFQLYKEFPPVGDMRDNPRTVAWESSQNGHRVMVKLWKREGWGDQSKEASRILDFLERAQELIEQPVPGFARIRRAYWLGDAIVLVQDLAEGASLDEVLKDQARLPADIGIRLPLLRSLLRHLDNAHQRQVAHGDLKPSNIVVALGEIPEPTLIDYLDFAPESDGERISSAYAPLEGGRIERDRYAVCCVSEEVLAGIASSEAFRRGFDSALSKVREGPPPNASLLPLIEALAAAPVEATAPVRRIRIGSSSGGAGALLPDEGVITLNLARHRRALYIRGACEQLTVSLDESGKPTNIRRALLDQKWIRSAGRFEVALTRCEIEVYPSTVSAFGELEALLADPEIKPRLRREEAAPIAPLPEVVSAEAESDIPEADEDEEIDQQDEAPQSVAVDIPLLWRQSIEIESELVIEAVATGNSAYRPLIKRHVAPIQMEVGEFEFDNEDTVMVSRFEGGNRWVKLGTVDTTGTRGGFLQIDTARTAFRPSDTIIQDGTRLRFSSHFEETSRQRRRAAVDRILARQSRIPDLIDIFGGVDGALCRQLPSGIDEKYLREKYGFNDGQIQAFESALGNRPGLFLQGPPGTGKTRFIGALIHYAITNGLARNVLVASQSHEAVNGAAESILKWFGKDDAPSVLRVGHEGNVSEQLLPFHTARAEKLLKDRFRGEFRERVGRVGAGMGIPSELCDDITYIETVAAPIARQILRLIPEKDDEPARFAGVLDTLQTVTARFKQDMDPTAEDYIENLCFEVARSAGFGNAMAVERFRQVVKVAEDFINSVSTRNRNFESFLAGTRQVVAGTCVGLGRTALGLVSASFDLVIVDEAARCTAGELAVPLQAGRWVVLVGDHHQLEPMIKKRMLEALSDITHLPQDEIRRSDFERVFERKGSSVPRKTLTTQYRMLQPIGTLVSDAFYEIGLEHGRAAPIIPDDRLPPFLSHALTWLTTDDFKGDGYQSQPRLRPRSLENQREAELIVDAIREWDRHEPFRDWVEKQQEYAHVIGIICTYGAQADLIRQKLRASYVSDAVRQTIKIDTVDSYQGKENPIVLLSLVRNNRDGTEENGEPTIAPGFMFQPNRINVAISRAMDRLVVVGASTGWSFKGPMARVVAAFERQKVLGAARYENGVEFRGLVGTGLDKRGKKGSGKGAPK